MGLSNSILWWQKLPLLKLFEDKTAKESNQILSEDYLDQHMVHCPYHACLHRNKQHEPSCLLVNKPVSYIVVY